MVKLCQKINQKKGHIAFGLHNLRQSKPKANAKRGLFFFYTFARVRVTLIEHYTVKRCKATVVTGPKRQKGDSDWPPALIVSSKPSGTYLSAASNCTRHSRFFFHPIGPQKSLRLPRSNDTTWL